MNGCLDGDMKILANVITKFKSIFKVDAKAFSFQGSMSLYMTQNLSFFKNH